MSPEPRQQSGGGLSLKTLVIAGAASATAAFLVPMIWEPGTVFAAAMTPIIVTVMTELLRRPADTVSAVAKRTTSATPSVRPRRVGPVQEPHEEFDPLAPPPPEDVAHLGTRTTERTVHPPRRKLTSRQWRLALGTGVLAFLCAVVFVTGSQLVAGKSIGGDNGNSTTFFSGSSRRDRDKDKEADADADEDAGGGRDAHAARRPRPRRRRRRATPTPTATPPAAPSPQAAPPAAPTPTPAP